MWTGDEPLDVAEATRFVSVPRAGGVSVFVGTVRSPNEDREVDHLFYEVWEEQVGRSLHAMAQETLESFGGLRAYVAHRTGRVEVGEPSVIVAVSTPHRAEAFDACRHLIDALKASAPIWKKEITVGGERWVGMPR